MTTLHQRIALLVVVATLLAVSIAMALNYQATRSSLLDGAQNSFISDLRARAQVAEPELQRISEDPATVRTAQAAVGGDSVVLYRDRAAWSHSRPDEIPTDLRRIANTAGIGMYYQRVTRDSRPQLVVALVTGFTEGTEPTPDERVVIFGFRDLSEQQRQLVSLVTTAIVATLGVLIVVAVGGYLAGRRLTMPLRRLDDAAKGLSEGRFTTVPVPRTRDETARLTTSFNDAARRLDWLVTDLQRREESSRQFAEDVAHELRTPLAAMLGVVEVLEDSAKRTDDPDAALAARTTVRETRRLTVLVRDLLEVSRPEADDRERLALQSVNLRTVVEDVLHRRGLDQFATMTADDEDRADDARARVDPRRIELIVTNLVTNAREHGAPPITVSVRGDGDHVLIAVRDHGTGVAPQDRHRIFDRFVKADDSRGRTEGSGLGLSIAARNARLHGGGIALADSEDFTEFVVTLPTGEAQC